MLEISNVSGGVSSSSLNLKRITTKHVAECKNCQKARKKPHKENTEKDEFTAKWTKYMHVTQYMQGHHVI